MEVNSAIKDKSIESVLLKLRALTVKSGSSKKKPEALPPVVCVPIPWWLPRERSRWLEEIHRSIELRRVLAFAYTKTDGQAECRR